MRLSGWSHLPIWHPCPSHDNLHLVAKRVTAEIKIFEDALDRPCGVPNTIVVLVLTAVRAGDVRFNSKSSASLCVGIRMESELSSEDWHLRSLVPK